MAPAGPRKRIERSERRLCQEVHLNLAYRWFRRLGLEDKAADHSSFPKLRHGKFRESGALLRSGATKSCRPPDVWGGRSGGNGPVFARTRIDAQIDRLKLFGERIMSRDANRQTAEIRIRIIRGGARTDGACRSLMNRCLALGGAEIEAMT